MDNSPLLEPQSETSLNMPRSSNLELYRIICMLLIVAHHYALQSELVYEYLLVDVMSTKNYFMTVFGAWGKTGINCFLMITGYFMCTKGITLRKFLKLILEIYFYKMLLFSVFFILGYETFGLRSIYKLIMPFGGINKNFPGCFIVFYLSIPFWNILIRNMKEREHLLIIVLLLLVYTLLGTIPLYNVTFNYATWFGIIYLISSYIRLYPKYIFERRNFWGWLSLFSLLLATASVVIIQMTNGEKGFFIRYFFISDSNKFMALAIAVCTFLWFKNINIRYNKIINAFGASTFGVLLIHANSGAMRTWLWKDTIDVVGHYLSYNTANIVLYSISVVLTIFVLCNLIDQMRIKTLEKWFFNWYDKNIALRADVFNLKNLN